MNKRNNAEKIYLPVSLHFNTAVVMLATLFVTVIVSRLVKKVFFYTT